MALSVSTRVHEWLADRISWVQYPQIRPLAQTPGRSLFRHQMHWTTRVLIGTLSLCAVLAAGAVLAVAAVVLKAVLFA